MPSPFAAVAKTLRAPLQDQKENIAKFLAPGPLQVSPFAAVAKTLPEPLQHALLAKTIAEFLQYFKGMPANGYTHLRLHCLWEPRNFCSRDGRGQSSGPAPLAVV